MVSLSPWQWRHMADGIPLGGSVRPRKPPSSAKGLGGGGTRFPVPWTFALSKFSNGQIMSIQIFQIADSVEALSFRHLRHFQMHTAAAFIGPGTVNMRYLMGLVKQGG